MRTSGTDQLGKELTTAYQKAKTSYSNFLCAYAKANGYDTVSLTECMVDPFSWDKRKRPNRYISCVYLKNGYIIEVYHWYGQKGIYAKR
jgi:hypothetical protein